MSQTAVAKAPSSTEKKTRPTTGNDLIAQSLVQQGVEYVFGIVGYPVQDLAAAMQRAGLKYIGMRNEQAGSYAAAAVGYLTGRPGACLTVTGPGVIHAVAGMANAKENCWPMICIGGSHETDQKGLGAFQEAVQLDYVRPATKYAHIMDKVDRIPFFVEQAVRASINGRPGAVHLDAPADIMRMVVDPADIVQPKRCPDPKIQICAPDDIAAAAELLKNAKSPLVIVGKGAAYAQAHKELLALVEATNMPFLPTPMGKGTLPDNHPNCVAPARSTALGGADVVLLVGARLNWILHYGLPPRYREDVKFIKVDIEPHEMENGHAAEVALCGHAKGVCAQLRDAVAASPFTVPAGSEWWNTLSAKVTSNRQVSADLASNRSTPMNYYYVLSTIQNALPHNTFIMSEGANTMDIGRTILDNYEPRMRLDAGTFGTMGVGIGQTIAACVVDPTRRVVAVMGDAAFGFSAMEYEVITRYRMNALIIILNNGGIGVGPEEWDEKWDKPYGAYSMPVFSQGRPDTQYENLCDTFGGRKWYVTTPEELEASLPEALSTSEPGIFHIRISARANRKKQEFGFDPTGGAGRKKKSFL